MKQALEFFPLIVFFAVFQLSGKTITIDEYAYTFDSIYSATIALVVATLIQVIIVKIACLIRNYLQADGFCSLHWECS